MDLFVFLLESDWSNFIHFLFVIVAFVQVYLSRKESKRPGLVLPIVWFGVVCLVFLLKNLLGILLFVFAPHVALLLMLFIMGEVMSVISSFIAAMIHPVLLMVIYGFCRCHLLKLREDISKSEE